VATQTSPVSTQPIALTVTYDAPSHPRLRHTKRAPIVRQATRRPPPSTTTTAPATTVVVSPPATTVSTTPTTVRKAKPPLRSKAPSKQAAPTVTTRTTSQKRQPPPPPKPVSISDNFDGGYIDPTIWSGTIESDHNVSAVEQGGQLVFTVGPDAVRAGDWNQIDVHVGTQCQFPSNFDVQVDYSLLEWPANDNISVELNAIFANSAVGRDFSSQWGDMYQSWVAPDSNGSVQLPDSAGSIRLTRVGTLETTYFWHDGSWRKLAEGNSSGNAVLALGAWSDAQDSVFGGSEVKVAFDNFKVSALRPICPPASQPAG
jgi:hypothetical protein